MFRFRDRCCRDAAAAVARTAATSLAWSFHLAATAAERFAVPHHDRIPECRHTLRRDERQRQHWPQRAAESANEASGVRDHGAGSAWTIRELLYAGECPAARK